MSWNALQNEDIDNFFDRIYEQSRSRSTGPTIVEDTTDLHDCIRSLPGANEFPLWRIGCRVCLSFKRLKKYLTV